MCCYGKRAVKTGVARQRFPMSNSRRSAVIASEARSPHERSDMRVPPGCRSAHPGYVLRNDEDERRHSRGADCARVMRKSVSLGTRGRRECRALDRTRSLVGRKG